VKLGGVVLGVLVLFVTLVAARQPGTKMNLRRWAVILLAGAFGVALVVTGYHSATGK
jgi:drug/metabolite transporter (DMT)-like permease